MFTLKSHNIFDYVVGLVLIVSPYLFKFDHVVAARYVFTISGTVLIFFSLLTRYIYSAYKIIALKAHLTLEALVGAVLIVSPFVFNYRDLITNRQFALNLTLALFPWGLLLLTDSTEKVSKRGKVESMRDYNYRH